MGLDAEALAAWLARETGAASVRIASVAALPGGSVNRHWRIAAELAGGTLAGRHDLVVRRGLEAPLAGVLARPVELAVMRAVFRAGVPVPEPLLCCEDAAVLGAPFLVMRHVAGTGSGRRIVRPDGPVPDPARLARELGAALARIHAQQPGDALPELGPPPGDGPGERLAWCRAGLAADGRERPILELAVRWLEWHLPEPGPIALAHGDFRTGNYLVERGRLAAILDWELAGWSDPAEDLAWLALRPWRFGADDRPAFGLAPESVVHEAYVSAGGAPVDRDRLRWWSILANLRWAVIAARQARRATDGGEPSLDLALTGWRLPETEHDLLALIGEAEGWPAIPPAGPQGEEGPPTRLAGVRPSGAELLARAAGGRDPDAAVPAVRARVEALAGRERRHAGAANRAAYRRLCRLLDRPCEALAGDALAGEVERLDGELAVAIRLRAVAVDRDSPALEHLQRSAAAALAIARPPEHR